MKLSVITQMYIETRYKPKKDILETTPTVKIKYPVKLKVTYKEGKKFKRIYLSTKTNLTVDEFKEYQKDKPKISLRPTISKLRKFKNEADEVIAQMDRFTPNAFKKMFFPETNTRIIKDAYKAYAEKLKKEGRLNSAETYEYSKKSILEFSGKETIVLDEIDKEFLDNYESWMIGKGKSITTIGIYLRCLRTLFNKAIQEGKIKPEQYPFGRHNYQIPSGRNIKKALTLKDIEKIYNYQPIGNSEQFAKDIWMFSYLCNGINIKDIANLRYKNLDGDTLKYIRSKTERSTKKDQREIVVYLPEKALEIIDQWKNKFITNETYLFSILHKGINPEDEWRRVRQTVQTINKYMGRIGKELKIEKPITTYTARHSYSTILKRAGVSTEFISESLGHHDLRTTENYLDSFEDDVKKKYSEYLTRF